MNDNKQLLLFLIFWALGLSTHGQSTANNTSQNDAPPTNLVAVTQKMVFSTNNFDLELNSLGKPVSFIGRDGQELLQTEVSKGLYLWVDGEGEISLDKVYKSGDLFVFASQDRRFYATFNIKPTPHYVAFILEDFYGDLPICSELKFKLVADKATKGFPFDYMTIMARRYPNTNPADIAITFDHLWEKDKIESLGGFAIYRHETLEEEDECILRIWGAEDVPHPRVEGEWNYQRAVQWMNDWRETFADQSLMYISPQNLEEIYDFQPYLDMAGVKTVNFFTDVWSGGFWPVENLNWEITGIFGNREELRKYSIAQQAKGQTINMHYVSGGIGVKDPLYARDKLSDDLASWVDGTLVESIASNSRYLYFEPKENWYKVPDGLEDYTNKIGKLSIPLESFFQYHFIKIGKELMRITKIEELEEGIWRMRIQVRGHHETTVFAHKKGSEVKGIVMPYSVYVADNNSPLFDEVAINYAEMLNYCQVYNTLFDGAEIHFYDGKWGYRKFAQTVYENLDHPVVTRTSQGKEPPSGFIEYKLNMGKELLKSPVGDHNVARASFNLERVNHTTNEMFASSNLLAANFMLSVQAASAGRNFSILRPDPMFGITLEELETYGRTEQLLSLLPLWKEVSKRMTEEQRQILQGTHTKYENKTASEVSYEVRETEEDYHVVPLQMMSPDRGTISQENLQLFHVRQEAGMYTPKVPLYFGETKMLENRYKAQSPNFIMRMMWGEGSVVNPSISIGDQLLTVNTSIELLNTETQYIEYKGGDKAGIYDKNWNFIKEVSVSLTGEFKAKQGYNQVSLGSENNSTALVELLLFTEGEPIVVSKSTEALW